MKWYIVDKDYDMIVSVRDSRAEAYKCSKLFKGLHPDRRFRVRGV